MRETSTNRCTVTYRYMCLFTLCVLDCVAKFCSTEKPHHKYRNRHKLVHLHGYHFQEQVVVVVPRPACNVRRNDAEITPGPAILPFSQS